MVPRPRNPVAGYVECPSGRQGLQQVAVPGDVTVGCRSTRWSSVRGENEPHGKCVHHRREPQTAERRDGRPDLVEHNDEIEVVVRASLPTQERVDAPAPVHPRVHSRRLEGFDRPQRRIPRASRPHNGKDGRVQIAFFIFPELTALDAIGPYEVLQRLPQALRWCSSGRSTVRSAPTTASSASPSTRRSRR